jgi:archaellum component FlaF (FlaF/FlaG flagellin family)
LILVKDYKKKININMNTNLLNEELKKFNLLSSYDTKFTLSENYEITFLNEQPKAVFQALFKDAAGLAKLADDFKFLFKNDTAAAETFFRNAARGKASTAELEIFMKNVLNNGGQIKKLSKGGTLYNGAIESYTKQLFNSTDTISTQFKNASEADRVALLKNAGYTDGSIKDITKQYKDLEVAAGTAGVAGTSGKVTSKANVTSKLQNVMTKAKNAGTNLAKNLPFLEKFKKVKNLPWKKIRNWALGLGVGAAALWYFMKNSGEPLPPDFPPTPPVDGDGSGGGADTSGGTGKSKYTSCPDTFPINQYCKNDKIKEIQACLSMPTKYQTGNFGTITQGYLEKAGVSGTEITQDSYNKVCNKTTSTTTVQPDENPEEQTISGSDDNF